jgi:hypothetical protein
VQEVRGQSVKVDKQEELTFDATPIENPLRFIEAHTSSQASVEKSFWLLSRLAFDTANAEPLRLKGIHR